MVLEKLGDTLRKVTDKVANAVFLDKNMVEILVRDLQRALIEADVNVSLVMELSKKIKKDAMDERIKGVEKKEHLIKLLHDELIKILGSKKEIVLAKKNRFMFVGLYGAGKTTTIGKLATYYAKRGHKVCTVGLDVHRPAAPEQLRQISEKAGVACFINPDEKEALKVWTRNEKEIEKYEIVLIDTAGRDALEGDLISEIKNISKKVKATETFLVMGADVGQTAKKQAVAFKNATNVTGVIITRMDSTAKAGGALTACAEVDAPVVFIGTGEKPADIESFDPESFLSRLLGMGDLDGLMEKIHSAMDAKEIARQQKKLEEGKFTLRDLVSQMGGMEEMGGMGKLMGMIPGMGKVKDKISDNQLEGQENKLKRWKHIIKSMTEKEIENPEIMEKQTTRIQRVAHGAGVTTTEVRTLLKQYRMMQEMMKSQSAMMDGKMDQKMMMKLARKFGKRIKF